MSVSDALDDYQETIALLQEEVVRLESELRSRDEADACAPAPAPGDSAGDEAARLQVESLLAELANRDETIQLLLEQARLFEEAESADHANWDQLNQWVEELERRVESGGANQASHEDLEAERRRAELDRQRFEADRRASEAQRQALESEVEKLRGMLAAAARQPGGATSAVVEQLQEENRRLRAATSELARVSAEAAEAATLRDQLAEAQGEAARCRCDFQQVLDDLKRERNEHEAVVNGLRSQAAHESLRRQEEQVIAAVGSAGGSSEANLSADERIRAFRQHLKEIHEKEAQERAQKRLSARLSRLWRNTGPRG
jgi:DNA repair exonuclease SbcCD ATPase subunit